MYVVSIMATVKYWEEDKGGEEETKEEAGKVGNRTISIALVTATVTVIVIVIVMVTVITIAGVEVIVMEIVMVSLMAMATGAHLRTFTHPCRVLTLMGHWCAIWDTGVR